MKYAVVKNSFTTMNRKMNFIQLKLFSISLNYHVMIKCLKS